jgi:FkbM family methyltransferase
MLRVSKGAFLGVFVLVLAVAFGSGWVGLKVGRKFERNRLCCQTPRWRNLRVAVLETFGLVTFPSQIGQDKWVSETVFPDVSNGFFLDVGSGDGTAGSNTKALERKGWTGICVDPFPKNMQDRTCQMLEEVVFNESGRKLSFHASGDIGGIADTLGVWKDMAKTAPTVEFTTTTLGDILQRTNAPRFIHFMSLDIEGAELEALKGFPFDKYKIGALAVEHNLEEPKRTEIEALMKSHGYRRVHTWYQDDFYLPQKRSLNDRVYH